MTARDIVMSSAGNAGDSKTYIEDVFSTYLYTGNGATQTITNGIDLAGKGGMVWLKGRSVGYTHYLFDTTRTGSLFSNDTSPQGTGYVPTYFNFNSDGFFMGQGGSYNNSSTTYASWTFRKAPKFFDVVTWTGDDSTNRQISHSLGTKPGMIIVKCTSNNMPWAVYSQNIYPANPEYYYLQLNSTAEVQFDTGKAWWNWTQPTASVFTVGNGTRVNTAGYTYVAYLFAHDTTTDGLIQCGSFTTDGSGNASVNLGWEPQYVIVKSRDTIGHWHVFDTMRGLSNTNESILYANTSGAEVLNGGQGLYPTATGFNNLGGSYSNFGSNQAYIYMAIRRPMKVPTDGTKVFKPIANMGYTGSAITTGFPYDLTIWNYRNGSDYWRWEDRLRGINTFNSSTGVSVPTLYSNNTNAESSGTNSTTYGANNTGGLAGSYGADPQVLYTFKRAPGFFDIVAASGYGSVVNHNLGVVPELIIFKTRSMSGNWTTWRPNAATQTYGSLNTSTAFTNASGYSATKTTFDALASSSGTGVYYLFASCPGVSKVGTYTGNGSSQTINCGFTNGARFVLIKKTSGTDNWYLWDSARGITTGNDPFVLMNATSSEYTSYDTIDPDPSGFIVNQEAIGQNSSGAEYLYLAIA